VSSDFFVKRSILWKSSGCFQSFQSLLVRARGDISAGEQASFRLKPGRYGWAQVARGSATLYGTLLLRAGEGAAVNQEEILEFQAVEAAELLLFDLA
jgi:redox-sensitive bicupin YhaK (pirin superfamily)